MRVIGSRRHFLTQLATAGVVGLGGVPITGSRSFAAEPPPEVTTVRLPKSFGLCIAPQLTADEMLRAEGFGDIRRMDTAIAPLESARELGRGEFDFAINYASNFVKVIDDGAPIKLLTGVHVGCFELIAQQEIQGIGGLKGKSVGVQALGSTPHVLLTLLAALVGLDAQEDIRWVTDPKVKPMEMFIAGKIDAFLGFPPEPQELRARKIGHVLVNTATDNPWSQYFCCLLGANAEFVRRYPVATKRITRAILKTTDLCATQPTRAAQLLADSGYAARYDHALQTLHELPYDKWREFDAEDTIRFYTLRMREAGFVKSTPQKIIAEGTDWRFLNELKRELKA
jgi:NitT/TauT family transport system substrate-binding protein